MKYRPKNFISLLGDIRLDRAYYHCDACHTGHILWDKQLRLSSERLTPAAQEVVTLLGIQDSFGKVAERTLQKSTGIRLSESTVERVTESAGAALGQALEAGQVFGECGESAKWEWHPDAEGKTCAYVSVDATGVLMQGPGGAKVEGRMVNVGMIFNPQPRPTEKPSKSMSMPCDGVRYLAGFYALDELGPLLRRQGGQVGMNDADQWIALTDAGSGLEHFMEVQFPRAVCVLDFQHPVGYLTPLANALRDTPEDREALLSAWCHTLKHEGGATMRTILESLDGTCSSASFRDAYETARTYFRNQADRMKYPEYLRKGWQIGSGAVESACKTVINQRLCMGGMRWGESGSDNVAHLRALVRSDPDQWDGFWAIFNMAA